MTDMVERVAKALVEAWPSWGTWDDEVARDGARAAIAAMREPTEAMLNTPEWLSIRHRWQAMIDEALK